MTDYISTRLFAPTTAIVTGSDSGIGRATAVALAEAGMDVGITWHSDEEGAQHTAELVRAKGQRALVAQLDTMIIPDCGDVIDTLAEQLGGLDVFVYCDNDAKVRAPYDAMGLLSRVNR